MIEDYYRDPGLYSIVYADVVDDIEPLVAVMTSAGGPVLEVCCGNGRVLVPAQEAGAAVDGLDRSAPMLADLRARLAAKGLSAGVHEGDMRTFALPRRYALVVIAFNSFLHNLTQGDQLATLRRCRAHLAPGGRLALAAFHPHLGKLLEWARGEILVKDIPHPAGPGRVRVFDVTTDDRIEQVRSVSRRIEFVGAGGAPVRTETGAFSLRYVFKPEMELLLRVAGFTGWSVRPLTTDGPGRPSFSIDRPLQEGDILLWTAWQDG